MVMDLSTKTATEIHEFVAKTPDIQVYIMYFNISVVYRETAKNFEQYGKVLLTAMAMTNFVFDCEFVIVCDVTVAKTPATAAWLSDFLSQNTFAALICDASIQKMGQTFEEVTIAKYSEGLLKKKQKLIDDIIPLLNFTHDLFAANRISDQLAVESAAQQINVTCFVPWYNITCMTDHIDLLSKHRESVCNTIEFRQIGNRESLVNVSLSIENILAYKSEGVDAIFDILHQCVETRHVYPICVIEIDESEGYKHTDHNAHVMEKFMTTHDLWAFSCVYSFEKIWKKYTNCAANSNNATWKHVYDNQLAKIFSD
jgi:hypothetical protein